MNLEQELKHFSIMHNNKLVIASKIIQPYQLVIKNYVEDLILIFSLDILLVSNYKILFNLLLDLDWMEVKEVSY